MPHLVLIAFVLVFTDHAADASAQRRDWLIVPIVTHDDEAWMAQVVEKMARELRQRGIRVWSERESVKRFQEKGSRAAMTISGADITKWIAHSRAAIWHLAKGEHAAAFQELKQAQGLSETATVELNRDKVRAQRVLDTCLYMVRALFETDGRGRAQAQARRCIQLVPHGEPSMLMHPPEVTGFYQAALGDDTQTGVVIVESEPSGCRVRLNGVQVGVTPLKEGGLFAGEYGVQVECGSARGRIHPVQVTAGMTRLFVDVRFDRAIRTEPLIRLRYASRDDDGRRREDAAAIGSVVPAGAVLLISAPDGRTMELDLVDKGGRHLGFVRVRTTARGPIKRTMTLAVASLIDGKCQDFTGETPVQVDCATRIASLAD